MLTPQARFVLLNVTKNVTPFPATNLATSTLDTVTVAAVPFFSGILFSPSLVVLLAQYALFVAILQAGEARILKLAVVARVVIHVGAQLTEVLPVCYGKCRRQDDLVPYPVQEALAAQGEHFPLGGAPAGGCGDVTRMQGAVLVHARRLGGLAVDLE